MHPCFTCRRYYPYKGLERRGSGAELVKLSCSGPQPLSVPFNILYLDNGKSHSPRELSSVVVSLLGLIHSPFVTLHVS